MRGRSFRWTFVMSLLGFGVLAGAAWAQPPAGPQGGLPMGTEPTDNSMLSSSEILGKMRSADQLEIRAAAIAQAKAQSRAVRDYADKLVRDHTALDQKLSSFATKNDINLGPIPMQTDTSVLDALRSAQGPEFDRQFLAFAVGAHDQAISDVKQMREQSNDPKLKSLLDSALPTLEQHRATAMKLQQTGGAGGVPQPRPESQGAQPNSPSGTQPPPAEPPPGGGY